MKHSICLETIFTELPFYDRFEAAAKAGFEVVEFWTWEDKDLKKILSCSMMFIICRLMKVT